MPSNRMTSISLPGVTGSGWAEWGHKTVPEMVAIIRERAQMMAREAGATLIADDEDFHVETYVGINVKKQRKILQSGHKGAGSDLAQKKERE